jgi:hypothetical protein
MDEILSSAQDGKRSGDSHYANGRFLPVDICNLEIGALFYVYLHSYEDASKCYSTALALLEECSRSDLNLNVNISVLE